MRGARFTLAEDAAVASAWINDSEGIVNCAAQKHENFIRQVTEVYNDTIKCVNQTAQSIDSIKNRSKIIIKRYTFFASFYAQIKPAIIQGLQRRPFLLTKVI